MKIKKPIYVEYNLDALVGDSKPIRITHIEDNKVDVLELCVRQGGQKINLSNTTVTARIVLHEKKDILLNDNVVCTVNGNGNALIPFDNAVLKSYKGIWKIEVNIRHDTEVLTLPHPLWVMVNDTILAAAEVLPESEGTIPELLKKVEEELKRVQGYVDMDKLFDTLDDALSGDSSLAPALFVKHKGDNYALVYVDSKDEEHELFDFASLPSSGGTADYSNLENKPQINGQVLDGNKTSNELGLQEKLAEGDNREIIGVASSGVMRRSGYYFTDNKSAIVDKPQSKVLIPNAQATAQAIGDSKIVSGSIDENGHIEFTDSGGNKFTTTGESVIGPQGDDGFSPSATVTQTASGATVTITDKNGTTTANISNGADGNDYVLTAQDKTDIANIVLSELPTTEGVLYGNTSN